MVNLLKAVKNSTTYDVIFQNKVNKEMPSDLITLSSSLKTFSCSLGTYRLHQPGKQVG